MICLAVSSRISLRVIHDAISLQLLCSTYSFDALTFLLNENWVWLDEPPDPECDSNDENENRSRSKNEYYKSRILVNNLGRQNLLERSWCNPNIMEVRFFSLEKKEITIKSNSSMGLKKKKCLELGCLFF